MDRLYLIILTNQLYRLTLLFPKKEPLRYRMRAVADDILAHIDQNPDNERGLRSLEVLDRFFEVAKEQKWVKSDEILNLQQEYSKLNELIKPVQTVLPLEHIEARDEIEAVGEKEETSVEAEPEPRNSLNGRQEKILSILKDKEQVQVGQLKNVFPEVDKRTLRRDFRSLLEQGFIERLGERNDTFYRLRF